MENKDKVKYESNSLHKNRQVKHLLYITKQLLLNNSDVFLIFTRKLMRVQNKRKTIDKMTK